MKGAFDLGVLVRYLDYSDGFTSAEWVHHFEYVSIPGFLLHYVL